MGKVLPEYIPLKYRSQVVAGAVYYIKVSIINLLCQLIMT